MTRTTRERRLSDGEIAVWLAVASTVAARPGARLPSLPPLREAAPAPKPDAPGVSASKPLPAFLPSPPRRPSVPPLAPLEKRLRRRVERGSVPLDGVMDLHGMTQAQAHVALASFLRSAAERGGKLVLVVTGKGRGGAEGNVGVLRRAVPNWLSDGSLREVVVGFEQAAQPHGGFGALYVRLRRPRLR